MGFSDIAPELIGTAMTTLTCFTVGYNTGVYRRTIRELADDPFRYKEYEQFMKEKKFDSRKDFFEYYLGMPGRHFAYRYLGNPKNWGPRE